MQPGLTMRPAIRHIVQCAYTAHVEPVCAPVHEIDDAQRR